MATRSHGCAWPQCAWHLNKRSGIVRQRHLAKLALVPTRLDDLCVPGRTSSTRRTASTARTTSAPSTAARHRARDPRGAAGGYSWAEGILGVPQVSVEWSGSCKAPWMGDRGIRGVMAGAPLDTVTARSRLCSVRYDSEKSVCTSYSALRSHQTQRATHSPRGASPRAALDLDCSSAADSSCHWCADCPAPRCSFSRRVRASVVRSPTQRVLPDVRVWRAHVGSARRLRDHTQTAAALAEAPDRRREAARGCPAAAAAAALAATAAAVAADHIPGHREPDHERALCRREKPSKASMSLRR